MLFQMTNIDTNNQGYKSYIINDILWKCSSLHQLESQYLQFGIHTITFVSHQGDLTTSNVMLSHCISSYLMPSDMAKWHKIMHMHAHHQTLDIQKNARSSNFLQQNCQL